MQQVMQHFFRDPLFASPSSFSTALPENRWFGDFSPSVFQPSLDVVDEGRALRITVELPGMSREDVELTLDDGALTIKGEKRTDASSDEKGCYRTERAYGYFQRIVPLPSNIAREGIEAQFEKGVLSVRIPKSGEAAREGKRIEVTGG
jgi:HSP20 family protein